MHTVTCYPCNGIKSVVFLSSTRENTSLESFDFKRMVRMNTKRQNFPAALGKALLLALLLYMQAQLVAAPGHAAVDSAEADVDVKEFRLEELETTLLTMPPGPEHDYFAGVLA